jgi:hypothetical protein
LFVIDSTTAADLLFVIEDSREKRRQVDEGTETKRIDQIAGESRGRQRKGESRLKKADDSPDEKRDRKSKKEEKRNETNYANPKVTEGRETSKKLEEL